MTLLHCLRICLLLAALQTCHAHSADITLQGSHVAGRADVALSAGNDINILAGQDTARATSHTETRKPGLFGSGGFGISPGSRRTSTDHSNESVRAEGSTVHADGNVNIRATGGDLLVRGSTIEAGKDLGLTAPKGNIVLEAAENRYAEQNSNRSSSASIGVGINFGASGAGVSVNASASRGKGQGAGESLSYTNTHVSAGGTATVQSGQDTTLRGAVVAGNAVRLDVGKDLLIESLQDQERYQGSSRSSGFSISVPIVGAGKPGASISASRTNIDSQYQSVGQQSGIRAGDGGFEVSVAGDATLTGGAITSTQTAVDQGKNRFETGGTLAMTDLDNRAQFDARGASLTVGIGGSRGSSGGGIGADSGHASSSTRSGISGVAGNQTARTGDAETGVARIFDRGQVQDNVDAGITATTVLNREGTVAWGTYANDKFINAQDDATAECWAPAGPCRAAGHALLGGITGGVGGAAGAGAVSMTADTARRVLRSTGLPEEVVDVLVQGYGLGVGGALGGTAGAVAATNEIAHNNAKAIADIARKILEAGRGALLACMARPACVEAVGPEIVKGIGGMLDAGDRMGESLAAACQESEACRRAAAAVADSATSFLGHPGKPITPPVGPNHTGNGDPQNPDPAGGSTATPNGNSPVGTAPGGKPITGTQPGDGIIASPIPEPLPGGGVVISCRIPDDRTVAC